MHFFFRNETVLVGITTSGGVWIDLHVGISCTHIMMAAFLYRFEVALIVVSGQWSVLSCEFWVLWLSAVPIRLRRAAIAFAARKTAIALRYACARHGQQLGGESPL